MSQQGDHGRCREAASTPLVLGPPGFLPVEAEATGLRDSGVPPPPPAQPPPVGSERGAERWPLRGPRPFGSRSRVAAEWRGLGTPSRAPLLPGQSCSKALGDPRPEPYPEPAALPRKDSGAPPGRPEATGAEVEEEEPFQRGRRSRQPAAAARAPPLARPRRPRLAHSPAPSSPRRVPRPNVFQVNTDPHFKSNIKSGSLLKNSIFRS